jgi:predicted ATPase/DNA-binding CsgD family transcriptional regulator
VGRADETAEVAKLVREHRLVTITGPGGVGKTRVAVEVVQRAAEEFPDGVHFVGLSAVTDQARVAATVAAVLGIPQVSGRTPLESLEELLASRRLLLVLDNCEHLLDGVAELCGGLLKSADDVHIIATSREQLWVGGETRYRLSPLALPGSDDLAEIGRSPAVSLFADRAKLADPGFELGPQDALLAARVVTRLDGMPLAIELAAARVEALGLAGLADRIDDALRLLEGRNALAAARHRSLAAAADWSYRLLTDAEQRVFRRLAVFPGPFTLEGAEFVAGAEAGPTLLRLVDCSLVAPPRRGTDGRTRYAMLQTLRAYGTDRLRERGEDRETAAALAEFALSVAREASADLEASDPDRELAALRWLDAEDATLSWVLGHEPARALYLGTTLAPWMLQRGRMIEAYTQLAAAEQAAPRDQTWARAQLWLGYLSSYSGAHADSLGHHTAAYQATAADPSSRVAVHALVGRAIAQLNLGQSAEATTDASRALELARQSGYRAGTVHALTSLGLIAYYGERDEEALSWVQQAQDCVSADVPGFIVRLCRVLLAIVLADVGDHDSARRLCVAGLAASRAADDQIDLANLLMAGAHIEGLAGNAEAMRAHLHEALDIATRTGDRVNQRDCLEQCGYLCIATERWADAATVWAAYRADVLRTGVPQNYSADDSRRLEGKRRIAAALRLDQVREAEERGTRMTLAVAAEFTAMLTAPRESVPAGIRGELTGRERELVTLVAQGGTNAEIAAQLFISIRTVGSHLDRIRDKTGCRRRADLTRLALQEGLV